MPCQSNIINPGFWNHKQSIFARTGFVIIVKGLYNFKYSVSLAVYFNAGINVLLFPVGT